MSWYFIDSAGTTQGPVELKVLETKWGSGQITADTYVWNGTTVNQWSLVKDTVLYGKLNKPKPAAPSGGSRPATSAPKKPKPAGGGRANLLDAIRSGKKLKKATTTSAGSGGSAAKKKPAGKLSLQEQLALRFKKGGGNKTGGGVVKAKPKPKPAANRTAAAPKKSYNQPKKFGANKKAAGGGAAPNKSKLKRMIDECKEDWVLKAVEKLLKQ